MINWACSADKDICLVSWQLVTAYTECVSRLEISPLTKSSNRLLVKLDNVSVNGSQSTPALFVLIYLHTKCLPLFYSIFLHKNWRTSKTGACKWRYFLTFSILFHAWFLSANQIYLAHWALECLVMSFLCSRWQRTYLLLCFYTVNLSETSRDLCKICFVTCGW